VPSKNFSKKIFSRNLFFRRQLEAFLKTSFQGPTMIRPSVVIRHFRTAGLLSLPIVLAACGANTSDGTDQSTNSQVTAAQIITSRSDAAQAAASPTGADLASVSQVAAAAASAEAAAPSDTVLLATTTVSTAAIDQVINDMSQPSEALVIDPRFSWQYNPAVTMHAPRGDAIPSWWTGNRPTWTSAVLSWFTAFEAQGNTATNTRVQLKNLRFYILSESTRTWSQVDVSDKPGLALWKYPFTYAASESASGVRSETSGGISVKPKYPNFHHGWGNAKSINPQDVRAAFATIDFRLAVDDTTKADDRAKAKYVVDVGADYYPDMNLKWSLDYAPGVGNGRMLLATSNWRSATLLVPNTNYSSTMTEMRTNPPPLSSTTTTTTTTTTPTDTALPTGAATITAQHSGKCMDVSGWSTSNNASIDQWSCNSGANQQWQLKDMGQSQYELISKSSGKCIDVPGSSTYDGTSVQQYSCNGAKNQLWKLTTASNGYRQIVSSNSGKCLNVASASTSDGAIIQQTTCSTTATSQRWMIK
jgi:hypothetical protein